jgi:SAM-dependent methyltransferase
VAKRQLVVEVLQRWFPGPGRLVEGGVGSSRNLLAFRTLGHQTVGLDVAGEAIEIAHRRGVGDVFQHDLAAPWPVAPQSVMAVVLLDVLEHIADPATVLRHAATALDSAGGVVLTVPAYPALYGEWDRRLGHVRRYRRRDLRDQAEEAGLHVAWMTHWNAFALPAAIVSRGLDRLLRRARPPRFPRVSRSLNAVLLGLARVERWCVLRAGVPCGLSLIAVLKK